MSKTVDERVVSMQFDNKQFEQNVKTSMSTIEKLKQSLKFKNAGDGFKNIETSAKRVDMKGLGSAVETVSAKFSALQVIGVTTLANITNSAVNAGKRIVSALTIDPIRSGFQEYETQINAVQTIMANVSQKGKTLDDVNSALNELNKYADQTIYNFTEMTRNIGLFTNAGVGLDESVAAIKGFSNAAAMAGTDATRTAGAMYQLSQAMSSGKVQLMDWRSLEQANITGERFQETIKETARAHGIAIDDMIKEEGNLRDTLKSGWLTADLMAEALNHYTLSTETMTEEEQKANRERLKSIGYTEEQIDKLFDLGTEATNAATKVKTFTQFWGVLQETAQSGWSKTWQLIFGDFEEAKSMWTDLSNFFTGVIDKISDTRNAILESALGKSFTSLGEKLNDLIAPAEKAVETVTNTVDAVTDLDDIVNKVIRGDFGNGEERINALTEAGQNYYRIQNKVNETLNNGFRYTEEQIAAQDKLLSSKNDTVKTTKEETKETSKLTEEKKELIKRIASMTEEQMRSEGYTEDQIEAFRDLGDTAKKLGIPLNEFIDNMDQINGRWLLLNSFKNIGKSIISTFNSISEAWKQIFEPKSTDEKADALFNIIAAFHKFTASVKNFTENNADNLIRTFKGIFAILDLVTSIVGGGFKLAFQAVSYILSYFNLNILDVTAAIGDALVWFRDWVKENNLFVKALKAILPYLEDFAIGIRDWIEGIKEADNIPQYIIQGLVNGLVSGGKLVVSAIIDLGRSIIDGICGVLGIHSPSTEFFEIGKNIILGLINGLKDGLSTVFDFVSEIGTKLIDILKKIDFGAVFAVGMGVGSLYIINKLANVLEVLSGPLEGIKDILSSISGVFDAISARIKAKIFVERSKAILNMAIAIGILAASIYALAQLDTGKLWATIGAIAALAGIILLLSFAASKMNSIGDFGKPSMALLSVAGSLLILSYAMQKLSTIKGEDVPKTIGMLTAMIVGMSAILIVFGKFCNVEAAGSIDKAGIMLLKISAALYVMVKVVKMAGKLDPEVMAKGLLFIGGLELFVIALVAVSKLAGEHAAQAGKMILKIAVALAIMVGVVKLAGNLDPEVMIKGLIFVGALELFVISLVAISKLAGEHASKAGSMLLKISVALLIMVKVVELAGNLEPEELIKGIAVVAILETFMIALIAVSKLAGQHAAKAGMMLMEAAMSLLIITGVLYLLGKMNAGDTARALGIVTVLEILFGGLIAVTKLAQNFKGTLITLTVCISILISAMTALTLVNPDKLKTATAALTLVISSFAALVAATGTLKAPKSAIKSLLPLVGVMVAVAAVLAAMSLLNVEPAIQTATSIGLLLNAMASAMFILSQATYVSTKSIGQLALMGLIVAEIGVILKILDMLNVEPSMQTVLALSTMMLAMSGALVIVGLVGTFCPGAMAGIAALVTLIGAMGLMMTGIGALNELTGGEIARFVNESIPILQDFGEGLGNFIGGFVGGIVAGALDSLSGIGTSLSDFMAELQPFINSVSTIDPSAMEGGKALAEMILVLTAANVLDGLSKFLGAGDMSELGTQLEKFGTSMVTFSNTVKGRVDQDAVESAAKAGMIMVELQKAIEPTGGFIQKFTGEKDLSNFGDQLTKFGSAIVQFSNTLKYGGGNIDQTAIESAKNAGMIMVELQKAIEPTGGWLQKFTGNKDLGTFGEQLKAFGKAITEFSSTVSEDGAINETAIESAKKAGIIMTELQDSIDPIGGVVSFFCGNNNLKKFGKQIKSFGKSIVAFSETIEEGGISTASAEAAKQAGIIMTELQKAIPEKNAFDGKVTLKKFGKQVKSFGKSIADYADEVSDIDISSVTSSVEAGKGIANTASILQTLDMDKIKNFDLSGMGDSLKSFYNSITGVDAVTLASATLSMSKLVDVVKSMKGIDSSGVTSFKSAINGLSTANVKGLANNFKSYNSQMSNVGSSLVSSINKGITSKQSSLTTSITSMMNKAANAAKAKTPAFATAGKTLMAKFSAGITSQKSKAASAFTSTLSLSITKVRGYYDNFYSAGKYLVSGFSAGISANTFRAEAKAKAMAEAAYKAAKDTLKINSPSKIFRSLAYSIPEGFAQGIDRRTGMAVSSSREMAVAAIYATKKSLSSLGNMVLSDIDSQPTIRPVLDLSDVNSGVNAINGMFGMQPSIGAVANIRAINSMMNNRQNGTNSDVVSAIDKLGKSLGNTGNTSYTINGITYDDGTNIAEAVQTLVRAARVEGRM